MYDNTYLIAYRIQPYYVVHVGFFLCVFFAWLADRIWKISGRITDSLINMA